MRDSGEERGKKGGKKGEIYSGEEWGDSGEERGKE